jgi:hypothetical protein
VDGRRNATNLKRVEIERIALTQCPIEERPTMRRLASQLRRAAASFYDASSIALFRGGSATG